MQSQTYFKRFGDDRELEVLQQILARDPTITVPVIQITETGFFSELYEPILYNTCDIILQKIKLLTRLHKIDVYHNDLGDANWVIKNGVVKLIDFGSAFLTVDDEWLQLLYENILQNDGEVITTKAEAFQHELTGFIESFP